MSVPISSEWLSSTEAVNQSEVILTCGVPFLCGAVASVCSQNPIAVNGRGLVLASADLLIRRGGSR